MKRRPDFSLLASVVLLASPLLALEIKLPEDTVRLTESDLPGYRLAVTYCYTCHSMDYVRMQPVSSRAVWRANVQKMQKTFGAPIPDDAVGPIVEYLVRTYGTEKTEAPAMPASATTSGKKSRKNK